MSAVANNFAPKWVLMEPFVSRRDYDESFPDESKAPIRTSSTTSWNTPFSVAFKLAKPPAISRLYAYLPGFPGEPRRQLLSILSTHQHLALFVSVRSASVENFPCRTCSSSTPPTFHSNYSPIVPCPTWVIMPAAMVAYLVVLLLFLLLRNI